MIEAMLILLALALIGTAIYHWSVADWWSKDRARLEADLALANKTRDYWKKTAEKLEDDYIFNDCLECESKDDAIEWLEDEIENLKREVDHLRGLGPHIGTIDTDLQHVHDLLLNYISHAEVDDIVERVEGSWLTARTP